jgi:hypothetical protein
MVCFLPIFFFSVISPNNQWDVRLIILLIYNVTLLFIFQLRMFSSRNLYPQMKCNNYISPFASGVDDRGQEIAGDLNFMSFLRMEY